MGKYRSKTVEIQAEQFYAKNLPWPADVQRGNYEGKNDKPAFYIETRSGTAEVFDGNWIIKEMDGKGSYPCDEQTFAKKYELSEPDGPAPEMKDTEG